MFRETELIPNRFNLGEGFIVINDGVVDIVVMILELSNDDQYEQVFQNILYNHNETYEVYAIPITHIHTVIHYVIPILTC